MSVDRYPADKLFDHNFSFMHTMGPVLAQIDHLLDDDPLYQMIRTDLAQRYPMTEHTGRPSTGVEVILRLLVVKRLYGYSFEQLEYQVADSLVLRRFCRVYLQDPPDDTTVIRAQAMGQDLSELAPTRFLRPIRQARQLAHQISDIARKTGEAAQKQLYIF